MAVARGKERVLVQVGKGRVMGTSVILSIVKVKKYTMFFLVDGDIISVYQSCSL